MPHAYIYILYIYIYIYIYIYTYIFLKEIVVHKEDNLKNMYLFHTWCHCTQWDTGTRNRQPGQCSCHRAHMDCWRTHQCLQRQTISHHECPTCIVVFHTCVYVCMHLVRLCVRVCHTANDPCEFICVCAHLCAGECVSMHVHA